MLDTCLDVEWCIQKRIVVAGSSIKDSKRLESKLSGLKLSSYDTYLINRVVYIVAASVASKAFVWLSCKEPQDYP